MNIPSVIFGDIEIDEQTIYSFENGIPGLRGMKRYAIVESEEMAPFRWLQSCDPPYLSLMIIDPMTIDADYHVPVNREHMEQVGKGEAEDYFAMALVVVPEDPKQMTANLLAPLLFNLKTRKAMQIVLEGANDSLLRVNVLKG